MGQKRFLAKARRLAKTASLCAFAVLCAFARNASAAQGRPELILQTGHSDTVQALAASPDGRVLASGVAKGAADRAPTDGEITVGEWFDYAAERVPQMQGEGAGRELVLGASASGADPQRGVQRPRAFYRSTGVARRFVIRRAAGP